MATKSTTKSKKPTVVKPKPAKKGSGSKTPVKKESSPAAPEHITLAPDALNEVRKFYEARTEDEMGNLHNRFVSFIAESRVPLAQVLLVLKILEAETIEIARQKFLGD